MTSEETPFKDAWQYCLRILSSKDYTVSQIYTKLEKREVSIDVAERVVDKLKNLDYLNDERFARNYCDSRVRLKHEGPYKIKRALEEKGISESIIASAVNEMKEEGAFSRSIKEAMDKWLRINGEPEEVNELRRLNDFLMRKGFESAVISERLADYKEKVFE